MFDIFVFYAGKYTTFVYLCNMEKKKTGGRARQFDPHKAVKVQLFVPENDVAMSVAVAKRAIMKRYKALQGGGCVNHE